MPQVVRTDIDNLNAVLTVEIPKDDYLPIFNTELRKYRKDARIKGFRQGKTPINVLKKMFGKAVLGEVINKILQEQLTDFMVNDSTEVLGQPIPSDDQAQVDFDIRNLNDFSFKFDIGIAPAFEVQGLEEEPFERYVIEIEEEMVEEEVKNLLQRNNEQTYPEDDIKEKDMVTLDVIELDGDEPKEDGVAHEFSILVERLEDDVKEAILKLKLGDQIVINPFHLEKGMTETKARKYFLGLEEDDDREVEDRFEAEITKISRIVKAELNQKFFDKVFGPDEVSSEEEFRNKLKENIVNSYQAQTEALLYRDIQKRLLDSNQLSLPDDFLKRWLITSNEDLHPAVLEKEYPAFADNLRWSLIRTKLSKSFEIEVTPEEIRENYKNKIRGYFGGASSPDMEALVENMTDRMLQDEKQRNDIYEEVFSNKLFETLVEKIEVKDKPISLEGFEAVIAEIEAERAAEQAAGAEEEE